VLNVNTIDLTSAHGGALSACVSPASYWMPLWSDPKSAWLSHAPFAFWLVEVLRPKMIVGLRVGAGHSYAAFCQAVHTLNLDCRCYGIDTWRGNSHHLCNGEDVFRAISLHNDTHYKHFSQLIQSDSGEALAHFEEASIDLLHIEGCHSYEAVQFDYSTWRSHLSESGVILFHDINVRERGFGVSRLWEELCQNHRHFEFWHGNGLGVLGEGRSFPTPLEKLFDYASDPAASQQIRLAYSRLGLSLSDRLRNEELARELAKAQASIVGLQCQLRCQNYLAAAASQRQAEINRLRTNIDFLENSKAELKAGLRKIEKRNKKLRRTSKSSLLTAPFRYVMRHLRHGTRISPLG
jgi:hypothetical protein